MAKVTYGSLVTDLRGSIGGITFQRNASGAIARLKASTTVNPSQLLSNRQTALGALVAIWPILTPTQQAGWSQLAIDHPFIDAWGISKQLNGYQQFLSNNLNLVSISLPALLDAPAYLLPEPPPEFAITFGASKMSLNYVSAVDPATYVLMTYATPLVRSTAANTRKAKYIIPLGTWDSSTILDITDEYCDYFNLIYADVIAESDCNVIIRQRFIDPVTGFASVYTSAIARVEPVITSLLFTFDSLENLVWIVSDYTNVAAWNTLLNLPTNGNAFTSVIYDNLTIRLFGGSEISLSYHSFEEDMGWIGIDDPSGLITELGDNKLSGGYFVSLNLPGLTNIPQSGITNLSDLTSLLLPNVTSCSNYSINNCNYLPQLLLPKCVSVGNYGFFWLNRCALFDLPLCQSIGDFCFSRTNFSKVIHLPVCTALGTTVGDNSVFTYILTKTIELTIPAALMTCNGGNPDGDITYLQANNTVTIIQT